jgi:hypothetical protein
MSSGGARRLAGQIMVNLSAYADEGVMPGIDACVVQGANNLIARPGFSQEKPGLLFIRMRKKRVVYFLSVKFGENKKKTDNNSQSTVNIVIKRLNVTGDLSRCRGCHVTTLRRRGYRRYERHYETDRLRQSHRLESPGVQGKWSSVRTRQEQVLFSER